VSMAPHRWNHASAVEAARRSAQVRAERARLRRARETDAELDEALCEVEKVRAEADHDLEEARRRVLDRSYELRGAEDRLEDARWRFYDAAAEAAEQRDRADREYERVLAEWRGRERERASSATGLLAAVFGNADG
jgi:hypothetical protein